MVSEEAIERHSTREAPSPPLRTHHFLLSARNLRGRLVTAQAAATISPLGEMHGGSDDETDVGRARTPSQPCVPVRCSQIS